MPQCTDSLGPVMVLGPDRKLGIVRDTTFQPFAPKREQFEIKLARPTAWLGLAIKLTYQLRPGDEITIHEWQKKIPVASTYRRKLNQAPN